MKNIFILKPKKKHPPNFCPQLVRTTIICAIRLIPIIFILFPSCTIKVYDTNKLFNDYTTEGFLDKDHYQSIIKGSPDRKKRGLVKRRESALNDAKSKMNDKIIKSLANYSLNYQLKKMGVKLDVKGKTNILNLAEVEKTINEMLTPLLQYGHITFEYYNENNSAVIVYRIFKDDLVDEIESIKNEFSFKTQKSTSKE